jgi:Cu(I)/Ag(I) efflux system membrane fusion protein
MKRATIGLLAVLLIIGSYLAGSWSTQRATTQHPAPGVRKILYYVDPMHPAYKSDKPGIAPDCGMELVPVYEDGSMGGSAAAAAMSPGAVKVSPDKQQLIGVKVAMVEKTPLSHTLRALGRVVPDETRISRINAATDGWVRKIYPPTTDTLVEKDELLAAFYAPEFLSAMRAYIYGLRSFDRFEASRRESKEQLEQTGANIDNYRNSLRNLGMTERQLDEIQRTRQPADSVEIRAPEAGFILAKSLTLGQRFEKGTELYRIADLSQVWIVADTFETEAAAFKPGTQVRVSAPQLEKTFSARVAAVPPRFDPASRRLQIRLEAGNPGLLLRPDMFVDVELPVKLPPSIAVPADAVVDSGVKKVVYVDKGNGVFEPRKVETGWRAGDQVEIAKGLMVGEKIVVSGTFLLDSESRMKAAAAGITGESSECPVCGMEVDQAKAKAAGRTSEFRGQLYYFCSDDDKVKFDKEPMRYAWKTDKGPATLAGKRLGEAQWEGEKAKEEAMPHAGHMPTAPPPPSGHSHP